MRRICNWSFIISHLFIWLSFAYSQSDSLMTIRDTTSTSLGKEKDTISVTRSQPPSSNFKSTKSPMLALGLSAVIPGAGQIYTENYWKPPIIWGISGYWIYEWITLNNKYKDFRERNLKYPNEQYQRLRDFYHDERDKFAWFLGALYILNLVDAYAGAHLYDFDVSPQLTLNGKVVPKVTASVRLRL